MWLLTSIYRLGDEFEDDQDFIYEYVGKYRDLCAAAANMRRMSERVNGYKFWWVEQKPDKIVWYHLQWGSRPIAACVLERLTQL